MPKNEPRKIFGTIPQDIQTFKEMPEHQVRDKCIAQIVGRLTSMDTFDLLDVAGFVEILGDWEGCTTPAESFVRNVVQTHRYGALLPEDVDEELKTFRRDMEDALALSRMLMDRYGESVESRTEGSEGVCHVQQ